MQLIFILAFVAAIIYTAYWFFFKKKVAAAPKNEPLPPFNPNPDNLQPKGDIVKEFEFIFKYAGETINRNGKTYTWDRKLGKYIEAK